MRRTLENLCLLLVVIAAPAFGKADIHRQTTTVYVSRQFEVRDQDQPTKYVFDGDTRIAEITGSLSGNQRLQRLRIRQGWNLVSLAVSADLAARLPPNRFNIVESVFQWNAPTKSYSLITSNQIVSAGTVFWIKAATNAIVGISGTYSEPSSIPVQPGGTYVAGSGLETWSPPLPGSSSAWSYSAATGQWQGYLSGDLAALSSWPLTIAPGGALYVQNDADISLEIPDPGLRIRYYHQDHLGSSSVVTDASGAEIEEIAFYPYGARRNRDQMRGSEEPYQFTQKEFDQESGLYHFEARYQAGTLSRFLTVDSKYDRVETLSAEEFTSFLTHPQKGDLYAYVQNCPIGMIDPTGLDSVWDQFIRHAQPAPPPVQTRQKATFSDQPERRLSEASSWRANLSAVCQIEPGKPDYRVIDSTMYGFDIDAHGNVNLVNPVAGSKINVTTFNVYRDVDKAGKPIGGVTITADYTGSCEYSLRWVQTIITTSPHSGCGPIYNDPCISDDPPGRFLPFYWTDKESPSHVQELDHTPASKVNDMMRQWNAIF